MANASKRNSTDRVGAFSDGVFAVIITIMVLDFKPPHEVTFVALTKIWPAFLSYVVSYLFVAIVWVNHHHLLRFADEATPGLIWWNFVHLFLVSFVPFATAWVADSRFAAAPVCIYALIFVLVDGAYFAFQHEALRQAKAAEVSFRASKAKRFRAFATLCAFVSATVVALRVLSIAFAMICLTLFAFVSPEVGKD